jgi:cobalt-zinc-cadmium efflux system outer membrane protein
MDVGVGSAAEPSAFTYTLDEAIRIVFEHNPGVSGAEGAIEQSQGQHKTATAYLNPTVSGSAGRGSIRDPSTGVSITERTVGVEQPLEWPGKREARQRAAAAGVAGAYAGLAEARLDLLADVKTGFYAMLLAQRRVELATENVDAMQKVAETVRVRVASGDATRFEAMKTEVEVLKARQDLARARSAIIVARAGLNALAAGALGDEEFGVTGEFPTGGELPALKTLVARALEEHPTAKRLGLQVEQAAHKLVQEEQSRYPNVTVSGQYHREAGDESVIAGLSFPFPVWYQQQGEIASARGARRRADAALLQVRADLIRAVTQQRQEVRVAKEQLALFENGLLRQAEKTVDIASRSFRYGLVGLLDVLDAQRVYRQMLYEFTHARFELATAVVRLERAAGGSL